MSRLLYVLLLLAGAAVAQSSGEAVTPDSAAGAAPGARAALESFSGDLEALAADFTQVVVSQDGEVMEEGAGEVWLQRPNRFRWTYGGDFPELIVADGERVWQYDESLEQVSVRSQSELAGDSPLLVITDLSGLDEAFRVTELGTLSDLSLLQLVSRDPDAQFERMVLGFRGDTLSRLVLEDAFGLRTELEFRNVRRNPAVPDGHFHFSPPAGVDLVGEVPDGLRGLQP